MRRIYPNDSERGIRGISRRFLRLRASRMQERFTALLDHFFSARSCKGHSRAHTRSSTYGPVETSARIFNGKGVLAASMVEMEDAVCVQVKGVLCAHREG